MLFVANIILVVFCVLVLCVKSSDAVFLPGIMFPLLIGRGSLYGIFGLIGVGMCYFLALLSLSSMDYLHKRRRENLDRIDTLRNNLLNSPFMQQMQSAMNDYDYTFQRTHEEDYYDSPIDDQNNDQTSDLYYNPPQIASKSPNKYNGPHYKPNYGQRPYKQYSQPYPPSMPAIPMPVQRPYASNHDYRQSYPVNRYPMNRDNNRNPGLYPSSSDMTYIRQRPPMRPYFRRRVRRSIASEKLLNNRLVVALLSDLNHKNSAKDKFTILYKELSLIRHKIVEN